MKSLIYRVCLIVSLCGFAADIAFAQVTVPVGGTISIPSGGNMNLGCNALNVLGNFSVNAGQATNAGDVSIASGGTVDSGQGIISVSGNWNNSGTFTLGTGTVVFTDGCAVGNIVLSGNTIFNNLNLTSVIGRTFVIPSGSNITVNGTLTLQGASGQPISLISSNGQTAVITLGPQAVVVRNFVNVNANVQIGATPTATAQNIPTLSEYGMITLVLLMLLTVGWYNKRRGFKTIRK
jgi:hypothetical protein